MTKTTIILSSPNQKAVVTSKTLSDAEHTYSRTNIEATLVAAETLSDNAFKLYVRMNLHQNDFKYALSPVAIKAEIGMSTSKYRSAVKELIRKGYLVLAPEMKNLYIFYEYPQKDCADIIAREPREHTSDQVTDAEGYGVNPAGHVAAAETSSAENEEMDRQIPPDNLAESDREIIQDITRNTTRNNEEDIPYHNEEDIIEDVMKSISFSPEQAWQAILDKRKKEQQKEQERREYEAMVSCVDPDDRHFYDHLNPDRDVSFGIPDDAIDWDDPDFPFWQNELKFKV